jgi:uncharacterized protein
MSIAAPLERSVHYYIAELRRYRPQLVERYGVATLGVFGSFIRNEQRPDSDLDVLVTFCETPSLFTLVALQDELCERLGLPVDLVMPSGLKPQISARILAEVVSI